MEKRKLAHLDGLRGIAAFIVLLCHLVNTYTTDFEGQTLAWLKMQTGSFVLAHLLNSFISILTDGDLAVYIFWLMSGYVISIKLFSSDKGAYLVSAFTKRYFRLMIPALSSVLFVYGLMRLQLLYNLPAAAAQAVPNEWLRTFYHFDPDIMEALRFGTWDTFFDFRQEHIYNPALWTMHPELYGSFFCFFLFGIFGLHAKRYLVYLPVLVISFLLKEHYLSTFILGFWLCDIDHSENNLKNYLRRLENNFISKPVWAISFFILLIILGGKSNFGGVANLFTSFLFVFIIMRSPLLARLFSYKWPQFLGKISFSLYLFHFPIICSLGCFLYLELPFSATWNALFSAAVALFSSLIIGLLHHKYIDEYAVTWSNKIGNLMKTSSLKIPETGAQTDKFLP